MKKSSTRVHTHRLKKLAEEDEQMKSVEEVDDLKTLEDNIDEMTGLKKYPDTSYRNGAFIDIDGDFVYEYGNTSHMGLVESWPQDNSMGELAFGYLRDDIVLIDSNSFMPYDKVVNDIKESDLNYSKIYLLEGSPTGSNNAVIRLAKLIGMKKQAEDESQTVDTIEDLVKITGTSKQTILDLMNSYLEDNVDFDDFAEKFYEDFGKVSSWEDFIMKAKKIDNSQKRYLINDFISDNRSDIVEYLVDNLSIDTSNVDIDKYEFTMSLIGLVSDANIPFKSYFNENLVDALIENFEDSFTPNVNTMYDLKEKEDTVGAEYILDHHPDAGKRDGIFVDIDGTVYADDDWHDTHSRLVGKIFFEDDDVDSYRDTAMDLIDVAGGEKVAFGHIFGKDLLVDEPTGMSFEDVVKDLKESDLSFDRIYAYIGNWTEDGNKIRRLAKFIGMKKQAENEQQTVNTIENLVKITGTSKQAILDLMNNYLEDNVDFLDFAKRFYENFGKASSWEFFVAKAEKLNSTQQGFFINKFIKDNRSNIIEYLTNNLSIDTSNVNIDEYSFTMSLIGLVSTANIPFKSSFNENLVDALGDYIGDSFVPTVGTMYNLEGKEDNVGDEYILGLHPDAGKRDGIFVDIDGTVYADDNWNDTHSRLVNKIFYGDDDDDVDSYRSTAVDLIYDVGGEAVAFGHIFGKDLLVDEPTGMSFEDVVKDLKESDLSFDRIYGYIGDWTEDGNKIRRLARRLDR